MEHQDNNNKDFDSLKAITKSLEPIIQGDPLAFCLDLYNMVQIWDDVYDGKVSPRNVNTVMYFFLHVFPENTFFQAHEKRLRPILLSAVLQWEAANGIEDGKDKGELDKAYMLRAAYYQVVHFVIMLVHGPFKARTVGHEVYKMYGETLQEYRAEFEPPMSVKTEELP